MIMKERVVIRKHEKIEYSPTSFYTLVHTHYDQDCYMEKHWHRSLEITYVVKGKKRQHMNNQLIEAPAGTLLLVNSQVSHDIQVMAGLEGIVLLIDRNYLDDLCPQCKDKQFDLELDLLAKQKIINHLFALVNAYEHNQKLRCHQLVLNIIDLLSTALIDHKHYVKEKHDDEVYELVTQISEYIDYHYRQKITLDMLSTMTSYNKSYLSSVFKKKTGVTIFEYLRNVRMQHCLDALKYTDETVVDIALSHGFANIQLFNRMFKELYQTTPNQYRQHYKNKI